MKTYRIATIPGDGIGLEVVPAPVRRDPGPQWVIEDWVPRASAWMRSYLALHEWAGLVQYRLRS